LFLLPTPASLALSISRAAVRLYNTKKPRPVERGLVRLANSTRASVLAERFIALARSSGEDRDRVNFVIPV